jgi:two-component system LytT family sensor kinase
VYNALTAIESFVRSDPERARDLLVGFAEFIRWSFREHSQYATLAEELRFVDTYLELERARFGDRLAVSLRVAPEVLPVRVPSLVLQPLVENAVRHGLERLTGTARLQISAEDGGHEAIVTVEDHGVIPGNSRTCSRGGPAASRSGCATSTSGFAPPSATTTG